MVAMRKAVAEIPATNLALAAGKPENLPHVQE